MISFLLFLYLLAVLLVLAFFRGASMLSDDDEQSALTVGHPRSLRAMPAAISQSDQLELLPVPRGRGLNGR